MNRLRLAAIVGTLFVSMSYMGGTVLAAEAAPDAAAKPATESVTEAAPKPTSEAESLADDQQWVKKCIKDNKGSGKSAATIAIYCTCMTDLMPESETQSVTQWEKTHPKEMAECDKKAGWK